MIITDKKHVQMRHLSNYLSSDIAVVDDFSDQTLNNVTAAMDTQRSTDDLLIITWGRRGDYQAAYHLMKRVQLAYEDVTVMVPGFASGPATLVAAGGNRLWMTSRSRLGFIQPVLSSFDDEDGLGWDALLAIMEVTRYADHQLMGGCMDRFLQGPSARINLAKVARDVDHMKVVITYLSELMARANNFVRQEPGHLVRASRLPFATIPLSILRESLTLEDAPEHAIVVAEAVMQPLPSPPQAEGAFFLPFRARTRANGMEEIGVV